MAKLTIEEELDIAIKLAARGARVELPSRLVAEDFFVSEREIVEHFSRVWVVEKLASLIRKYRAKERSENDPQMLLGFKVPRNLVLRSGDAIPFGDATLRKLRLSRAQVWKEKRNEKHPAVERLDKAIALMERYATEQRGITYKEALTLEVARLSSHAAVVR